MARRYTGKMNGERYLGNKNKKEVHDLDNEKTGKNECQIDEIIKAGNEEPFNYLEAAKAKSYDNCAHCLGNSKR